MHEFEPQTFTTDRFINGAMLGLFSPGRLAEELLGEVSWSAATCYFLKRFGLPNKGHDDYKRIADWRITTPKEGLYLVFSSAPYDVYLLFGYSIETELMRRIGEEHMIFQQACREQDNEWIFKQFGRFPESHGMTGDEMYAVYDTPEKRAAMRLANEPLYAALRAANVPDPAKGVETTACEEALKHTIICLKEPVSVRDQSINIYGVFQEPEA